eukprot:gnl/MRDRNA2_/MRDRNA2_129803_c0_seq1.p1 gnl/MRDRNA2_/MRDRNA2_129803_c0~~gnl/MRDRNA2_/MRDRNA2_129803_c0_seq1.p1  ORF type:complete len:365 (+),score=69.65 gnl/MRDRNA2_/MRDRNA2_129803_c0_seq1:75-1169(+)
MLGNFGLTLPVQWPSAPSMSCKEPGKRSNVVSYHEAVIPFRTLMITEPITVAGTSCVLQRLPAEVFLGVVLPMFDRAQPVSRLATCSRYFWSATHSSPSSQGIRLRSMALNIVKLGCMEEALRRTNPSDIQVLRVDLSCEERRNLGSDEIEAAVQLLGKSLRSMPQLRILTIRLASFDAKMERIRLGRKTWEAMTRGLAGLSQYGRLRTLELSSMAIKASQATQQVTLEDISYDLSTRDEEDVDHEASIMSSRTLPVMAGLHALAISPLQELAHSESPSMQKPSLNFLDALGQLSCLEELRLTYDEIFSTTALLLPPAIQKMPGLKVFDLTRNHIPKQVMLSVRTALPEQVQLEGDDQQTFFFY